MVVGTVTLACESLQHATHGSKGLGDGGRHREVRGPPCGAKARLPHHVGACASRVGNFSLSSWSILCCPGP